MIRLKGHFPHFMSSFIHPYAAGVWFRQYKILQKKTKMTETLSFGYSSENTQWELSYECQHDRV